MKTTDKIVLSVANDLDARSIVGIEKYGTTLDRTDLSLKDWLQHAYEETLDKALYLKRAIIEIEQNELRESNDKPYYCYKILHDGTKVWHFDDFAFCRDIEFARRYSKEAALKIKSEYDCCIELVESTNEGKVVPSPIIEGATKSNVKNNKQIGRKAPPPPPIKGIKNKSPEEQCKAILSTLEEPYRTQALEHFDSEYFENNLYSFNGTKSRALLTSFKWGKSNLPIAEYYNKLTLQGE